MRAGPGQTGLLARISPPAASWQRRAQARTACAFAARCPPTAALAAAACRAAAAPARPGPAAAPGSLLRGPGSGWPAAAAPPLLLPLPPTAGSLHQVVAACANRAETVHMREPGSGRGSGGGSGGSDDGSTAPLPCCRALTIGCLPAARLQRKAGGQQRAPPAAGAAWRRLAERGERAAGASEGALSRTPEGLHAAGLG